MTIKNAPPSILKPPKLPPHHSPPSKDNSPVKKKTKNNSSLAQQSISGFVQVDGQTRRTKTAKKLFVDDDHTMTDDSHTSKKKGAGYYDELDSDDDDDDDADEASPPTTNEKHNTEESDPTSAEKQKPAAKPIKNNKTKKTPTKTNSEDEWDDNLDEAIAMHDALLAKAAAKKKQTNGKATVKKANRARAKTTKHTKNQKNEKPNTRSAAKMTTPNSTATTSTNTNNNIIDNKEIIQVDDSSLSSDYDTDDPEDAEYKKIIHKRRQTAINKQKPTNTSPQPKPSNAVDLKKISESDSMESDEEKFTNEESEKIKRVYSQKLAAELAAAEKEHVQAIEALRTATNQRICDRKYVEAEIVEYCQRRVAAKVNEATTSTFASPIRTPENITKATTNPGLVTPTPPTNTPTEPIPMEVENTDTIPPTQPINQPQETLPPSIPAIAPQQIEQDTDTNRESHASYAAAAAAAPEQAPPPAETIDYEQYPQLPSTPDLPTSSIQRTGGTFRYEIEVALNLENNEPKAREQEVRQQVEVMLNMVREGNIHRAGILPSSGVGNSIRSIIHGNARFQDNSTPPALRTYTDTYGLTSKYPRNYFPFLFITDLKWAKFRALFAVRLKTAGIDVDITRVSKMAGTGIGLVVPSYKALDHQQLVAAIYQQHGKIVDFRPVKVLKEQSYEICAPNDDDISGYAIFGRSDDLTEIRILVKHYWPMRQKPEITDYPCCIKLSVFPFKSGNQLHPDVIRKRPKLSGKVAALTQWSNQRVQEDGGALNVKLFKSLGSLDLPLRDITGHVRSARAVILTDIQIQVSPTNWKNLYSSVASYATKGNRQCVLTRFAVHRASIPAETAIINEQAIEGINRIPQILLETFGLAQVSLILASFILAGLEQDLQIDIDDIPDDEDIFDFGSEDESLGMDSALQISVNSEVTHATTGTARTTQSTRDRLIQEQDRSETLESNNEVLRQQVEAQAAALQALYARMNLQMDPTSQANSEPPAKDPNEDAEMTTGTSSTSTTSPAHGAEGGGDP